MNVPPAGARTAGRSLALLAAVALIAFPSVRTAAQSAAQGFEDITAQAGVAAPHRNRAFDNEYSKIMAGYTALGASAAVADYDGDGFEDLFVTDSAADGHNHLYHNSGHLTFTDVTAQAGLGTGNDAENASADSLWFDFNNDGRPDLLVVRFGHNQLFQNLGGGKFKDITKAAGLDRYMNAMTASSICSSATTSRRSACFIRRRPDFSRKISKQPITAAA
jgi:hypothetical protein